MKLGKFGSFAAAIAAALYSTFAVGETYEKSINLNVYDESVLTVAAGDTCKLKFTGDTFSKKFAKEGNGNITIDNNANFTLASFSWKGAGVLTVNDTTFNVSGTFGTYGSWNEQSNVFNNCTLTAGTFHNDCNRNRLHYGYTFFNGGTYTFDKLYVTSSDSGSGSVVTVQGGAQVKVNTELFCVRLTSGDPGVARLVIEDGSVTTPQINLGWANATQKQGAVELLGGTLTTKTIVNGPGNADYVLGNGGTFVATTKDTDILPSGIEHVYIGINGMTVESDVDVTISKAFEPWSPEEGVSETGPLYKTGTGKLTLTGDASAHGKTVIAGGSLAFGADVATHPAVELAEGGSLDWTGCTTKLAGLVLSGGTLKLGPTDTIELTAADSFDPRSVTFDLSDISTIHTTYSMVKVPGQVSAAHVAAWAAMTLPEVPEIIHVFKTVYDEASDTTTYVLSIEIDPNVRRQITVTAGEGGSVDFENGKYPVDTPISLTAVPDDGYSFTGWTGDVAEGHELDNPLAFVVGGQDISIQANFAEVAGEIDIDLSGGDMTVEVGYGCSRTVRNFTGNASATLSIVGGGHLTMPEAATATSFAALVIDGVMVDVATIGQLGAGPVTIRNNGGLHLTGSIKLANPMVITVEDSARFDIDETAVFTVQTTRLKCTDTQITKTGLGTLTVELDGSKNFNQPGYWTIKEGFLKGVRSSNTSSAFIWSEANIEGPTIELQTGATMQCVGALPKIVLAGGTLEWTSVAAKTGTGIAYDHNLVFANNGATTFILNGGVEVLPSEKPSQICGDTAIFSGTNDRKMEINVHEGATLDVYAEFIPRLTSATATDYATVRKTGAGTLRFNRPIRAAGVCMIEEGAVEMGKPLARPDAGFRFVPAGGTLRLTDATAVDLSCDNALLSSAAVWFDATKISAAEGATLSSVANLGICGGCAWNCGLDTVAATYTAAGIGGLPCFVVNGKGGELLKTYANGGTAMTVFSVARNTSWTTGATHGEGGSPVQICNASGGAIFGYNFSAANAYKVVFGGSTQTFTGTGVVPTDDTPFINEAVWSGTSASFRQWWSDAADAFEWSGTVGAWPSTAAWVAIGSRCEYSSGMDSGRRAKGMVGQIGEVLVFNRVLTADETAYVRSYLQRKWFGSTVPEVALPATAMPEQLGVEVGEGEKALLNVQGAADIAKRDAGELVLAGVIDGASKVSVEEGTIGFNTNGWRTAAAVWVDAADASTIVMDGESVVSVANKGVTGGTFTPVESYSGVDSHPKMDAINGTAALLFEGAQGIGLDTFVPGESRNEQPLYIYLVAERTTLPASLTGPFTLTTKAPSSVLNPEGSFSVGEAKDNNQDTKRLYVGLRTSNVIRGYAGDGVPFIDVCATSFMRSRYADITAETTAENAKLVIDGFTEKTNVIDFTVLGGFLLNGKLKGETRYGTTKFDYGWKGKIGEFIVFTSPLSEDDEKELLDYLSAKWLDASAEPQAVAALPRVLGGGSTAFAGGNVDLAFADGTAIDFESPAVTVNDLVFGSDLSLWYAPVPAKGGLAGIFAYDGEVEGFDSKEWTVTGGPRVKGKLGVVNEPGLIALDYKKNGLGIIVR